VCFTYGTWFGITALAAAGSTLDTDPALYRAVQFLVSKQRLDGGWGESYLSCQDKVRQYTYLLYLFILFIYFIIFFIYFLYT
jgi:squalene cyclase